MTLSRGNHQIGGKDEYEKNIDQGMENFEGFKGKTVDNRARTFLSPPFIRKF